MGRNLIHLMQSHVFQIWDRFTFLDYERTDKLVRSLRDHVAQSGYSPEVIVGISSGGDYPAQELSDLLGTDLSAIGVRHYALSFAGFEFDEIVGLYRLAKTLGYQNKTFLTEDVSAEAVHGRRVLIVDDDSYSGKTLEIAKTSVDSKRPSDVRTAVLHTHRGNKLVDFAGEFFPRREYYDSRFRFPWSKISPFYARKWCRV